MSSKRLPLVARRDLVVRRHWYEGRLWYAIQEPLAVKSFRLREEEYFVLGLLDGQASVAGIQQEYARRYRPHTLAVDEVLKLLKTFAQGNLAYVDAAGQGAALFKKRGEELRKKITSTLTNILWLRLRGLDPDRVLARLLPYCRWMFSLWAVLAAALLGLAALGWVLVQYSAFQARLPSYQQFFTPQTGLYLMAMLGLTKVLHELGHGLACKHYGAECHELGLMLLVFTPTMYCDARGSTLLASKWQRMTIAAAGMYVELVLASLATFGWWFSQPGLFHHLCLATMFVCSVSTVVFNINPLMRYDGYYILSDYLEIPNLAPLASEALQSVMGQVLLGIEPAKNPFLPQRRRWLFAFYAIASAIYRWIVTFSILYFLCKFFEPHRLKVLGQSLAAGSFAAMVGMPLWKLGKFFWIPGRTELVQPRRMKLSLAIIGLSLCAVVFVPLPHSILATVEIEPDQATAVYVEIPGTLDAMLVRSGEAVEKGQLIGRMVDEELQLALERLSFDHAKQQAEVKSLRRQVFDQPSAASELPASEASLASLTRQLDRKRADVTRLELRAPQAGVVLPPPPVAERRSLDGRPLGWSGTPLEPRNRGCFLEPGTLVCHVGPREHLSAHIIVDQQDIDLVREGQVVDLKLDELPRETLRSQIARVARLEMKVSPQQLSNKSGGELATKTDSSGVERPLNVSYEADAPLAGENCRWLRLGLRGRAKIHTSWMTVGARFYRWFGHTFHFEL